MTKSGLHVLTNKVENKPKTKSTLVEALVGIITREPRLRLDPRTCFKIANRILEEVKDGDNHKMVVNKATQIVVYESSIPEVLAERLGYNILEFYKAVDVKEIKPYVREARIEMEDPTEVAGMGDVMENAQMVSDILNIVQDQLGPTVPVSKVRLAVSQIIDRVQKG